MIRRWRMYLLVLAFCSGGALAQNGRGELLYETYCHGCHNEQLHWRDRKVAKDWAGLVSEVRRWQANGNLDWSDDDVDAVVRHLNTLYYCHPVPPEAQTTAGSGSTGHCARSDSRGR